MRFEEKLKRCSHEQLWQEYCGFLDMSLAEYMYTQRRLMESSWRFGAQAAWAVSSCGAAIPGIWMS